MSTRPSGDLIRPVPLRFALPQPKKITWGAGLRWAFGARAWCGFIASLSDGRLLLRHELTWLHTTEQKAAEDIKAAMKDWHIPTLAGGVLANHDLWPDDDKTSGESRAETFIRCGITLRRGSKDRLNNFARLRSWLATIAQRNGTMGPSLLIHPDCKYFLRTMPVLVSSSLNVDDVSECAEEYPAVGAALYVMSRPLPTVEPKKEPPGPGTWGYELRHVLRPPRRVLGAENVRMR